jgi:hypothetical protein
MPGLGDLWGALGFGGGGGGKGGGRAVAGGSEENEPENQHLRQRTRKWTEIFDRFTNWFKVKGQQLDAWVKGRQDPNRQPDIWEKFQRALSTPFIGASTGVMAAVGAASPDALATLTGSFKLLGAVIGQMLLPGLLQFAVNVQSVYQWVGSWGDGTKMMVGKLVWTGLALTGIVLAVSKVVSVLKSFGEVLAWVKNTMGTSYGRMAGAALLATGALAALSFALSLRAQHQEEAREARKAAEMAPYTYQDAVDVEKAKQQMDQATEQKERNRYGAVVATRMEEARRYQEILKMADPKERTALAGKRAKEWEIEVLNLERSRNQLEFYRRFSGPAGFMFQGGPALMRTTPLFQWVEKKVPGAKSLFDFEMGLGRLGEETAHAIGDWGVELGGRMSNRQVLNLYNQHLEEPRRQKAFWETMQKSFATGKPPQSMTPSEKAAGLNQFLVALNSVKAQPQFTGFQEAYKRIQVEALGKDPITMELERIQRESLDKMLAQMQDSDKNMGGFLKLIVDALTWGR